MASQLLASSRADVRLVMRCWGDFALRDADSDEDIKPRGRKVRALLAYLAMHPDKPVSRAKLTGLLWGERGEEQARASLRQALFELRPFASGRRMLLKVDRESVMLIGDALDTDIAALHRLAAEADGEALLATLPEADDTLFANLDDVDPGFDDWLGVERTRQRDALTVVLADASAGALAAGRTRAARALHARLLEFNPDIARPAAGPAVLAPPAPVVVEPERIGRRKLLGGGALLLGCAVVGGTLWLRPEDSQSADAPSREVRGLYDAARAIIYDRKGADYPIAIDLLRRALVLAPDYAPVLASLAFVTATSNRTPEGSAAAEALARRAIRLDPELAEAHGVLGMALGFQSKEARAAIKHASALDARDPQIQFWLSNVLATEGDYVGRLDALRRAAATDPLWHRASGMAALAAWELGHFREAASHAARLRQLDLRRSFECGYAIDWASGDYADVIRDTLAVREQLTVAEAADFKLGSALLTLGYQQPARLLMRLPPPLWRIASDAGPAPGELQPLLRGAEGDPRANLLGLTGLRQVLRNGRVDEIVAAYDDRVGDAGAIASDDAPNAITILTGVQVALALRGAGREREAVALLDRADLAVRRSQSHGALPNWMYAGAAAVWAAQGRTDEAVASLATAIERGWQYNPLTPLPDMGDIPSFASLRGDARFEALRGRLKDHIQRERRKLGPAPV